MTSTATNRLPGTPAVPSSITEIERLDNPTREQFERDYVNQNRPVILTGVSSNWPAMTKWTPENLRANYGDRAIEARFEEHGDFHAYYTPEVPIDLRSMKLSEYLDLLHQEPPETRYYMAQYPISRVSRELLDDVDAAKYILRGQPNPAFFIGRDAYSCNHYHGHGEALCCPIIGDRQVTLFAPGDSSRMYANRWHSSLVNFSRVDARRPDLERYPKYRDAHPITFTLRAGEILFIPVHWWHAIESPGFTVAAVFFWKARWRHFQFPNPGAAIVLHSLLSPVSVRVNAIHSYRRIRQAVRLRKRAGAMRRMLFGT